MGIILCPIYPPPPPFGLSYSQLEWILYGSLGAGYLFSLVGLDWLLFKKLGGKIRLMSWILGGALGFATTWGLTPVLFDSVIWRQAPSWNAIKGGLPEPSPWLFIAVPIAVLSLLLWEVLIRSMNLWQAIVIKLCLCGLIFEYFIIFSGGRFWSAGDWLFAMGLCLLLPPLNYWLSSRRWKKEKDPLAW